MAQEVVTIPLAETAEAEEATNERIEDAAFVPQAPLSTLPTLWEEKATYAKGVLVWKVVGGQVYRSTENGNKEHDPAADADYAHWQPCSVETFPLVNPAFGFPTATRTQHAFNKPPARSDAAAPAAETINPGDELGFGQ